MIVDDLLQMLVDQHLKDRSKEIGGDDLMFVIPYDLSSKSLKEIRNRGRVSEAAFSYYQDVGRSLAGVKVLLVPCGTDGTDKACLLRTLATLSR